MRRGLRGVAAGVVLVLVAGCSGGLRGESDTDGWMPSFGEARPPAVDTPELRAMRDEAGIAACEPGPGEPGSNEMPELVLPCLGGGDDVDLSTLRGPMLVNVWGSWCAPCVKELPVLAQFDAEHGDEVAVLGVQIADQPEPGLELLERSGVRYPQVVDFDGVIRTRARFAPFTFLIDADGEVLFEEGTPITEYDQLLDLVGEHFELSR